MARRKLISMLAMSSPERARRQPAARTEVGAGQERVGDKAERRRALPQRDNECGNQPLRSAAGEGGDGAPQAHRSAVRG